MLTRHRICTIFASGFPELRTIMMRRMNPMKDMTIPCGDGLIDLRTGAVIMKERKREAPIWMKSGMKD